MTVTTAQCPSCGGTLQLIRDGMVGQTMATLQRSGPMFRTAWVLRPFWACTTCEFCEEFR